MTSVGSPPHPLSTFYNTSMSLRQCYSFKSLVGDPRIRPSLSFSSFSSSHLPTSIALCFLIGSIFTYPLLCTRGEKNNLSLNFYFWHFHTLYVQEEKNRMTQYLMSLYYRPSHVVMGDYGSSWPKIPFPFSFTRRSPDEIWIVFVDIAPWK